MLWAKSQACSPEIVLSFQDPERFKGDVEKVGHGAEIGAKTFSSKLWQAFNPLMAVSITCMDADAHTGKKGTQTTRIQTGNKAEGDPVSC